MSEGFSRRSMKKWARVKTSSRRSIALVARIMKPFSPVLGNFAGTVFGHILQTCWSVVDTAITPAFNAAMTSSFSAISPPFVLRFSGSSQRVAKPPNLSALRQIINPGRIDASINPTWAKGFTLWTPEQALSPCTRPSSSQAPYPSPCRIRQGSLISLLLLSPRDPLRWARAGAPFQSRGGPYACPLALSSGLVVRSV